MALPKPDRLDWKPREGTAPLRGADAGLRCHLRMTAVGRGEVGPVILRVLEVLLLVGRRLDVLLVVELRFLRRRTCLDTAGNRR